MINLFDSPHKKQLDTKKATSIICSNEILKQNKYMKLVAQNRENLYFEIIRSNTIIMHVEKDFCILIDNLTISQKGQTECIPKKLSARHYAVYQSSGSSFHGSRDWIKNTSTSKLIGYDIINILHKNFNRQENSIDHFHETFDERNMNRRIIKNNFNEGSHRKCIVIQDQAELNKLLARIVYTEHYPNEWIVQIKNKRH